MIVDWDLPIEAFNAKGEIKPAAIVLNDGGKMPWLIEYDNGGRIWARPDGTTGTQWIIRNVASDAPTRPEKAPPDADTENQLSQDTQGLQTRCEALIRHAAVSASGHTQEEARAIVRELDIRQLITDLMAKDMPERDKLVAAFEAGRADRFELENGA